MDNWIKFYRLLLSENQYIKDNVNKYAALTKREKELVSLLVEGKSAEEISGHLNIAPASVKAYQRAINKKLIVHKDELIKFARIFQMK